MASKIDISIKITCLLKISWVSMLTRLLVLQYEVPNSCRKSTTISTQDSASDLRGCLHIRFFAVKYNDTLSKIQSNSSDVKGPLFTSHQCDPQSNDLWTCSCLIRSMQATFYFNSNWQSTFQEQKYTHLYRPIESETSDFSLIVMKLDPLRPTVKT